MKLSVPHVRAHTESRLVGHFSRDCREPKDWNKVKCNQCGESTYSPSTYCSLVDFLIVGHTIKRCTQPAAARDAGDGGFDNDNNLGEQSGAPATPAAGGWDAPATRAAVPSGW